MQKDFIQPRRIEAFGHVPGGAVHEVPLQIENGVYIAADCSFAPGGAATIGLSVCAAVLATAVLLRRGPVRARADGGRERGRRVRIGTQ